MREEAKLTRDVEGIVIPDGHKMTLFKDSLVTITQALGGTFTVYTDRGYMVRIDGKDSDALGKDVVTDKANSYPESRHGEGSQSPRQCHPEPKDLTLEEQVWEQLKSCYDPEIPVDIVNLGLIYDCQVTRLPDALHEVSIKMTLTAPGCGMGDILKNDVETKILALKGVKTVHVEMVFDPPWDQSRMSDEAKIKLGLM